MNKFERYNNSKNRFKLKPSKLEKEALEKHTKWKYMQELIADGGKQEEEKGIWSATFFAPYMPRIITYSFNGEIWEKFGSF